MIGLFHSFIFYGFVFYGLVNLVDAIEGYVPFTISSTNPIGATYNLLADILGFLVLLGVIALVIRRFASPAAATSASTHARCSTKTFVTPKSLATPSSSPPSSSST